MCTDSDAAALFAARGNKDAVEKGTLFAPKFDDNGLIICITTDADSGEVVMVAYMNAHSLALTLETGEAHYWSRSRGELWHKGATSGSVQKVVEARTDCDQDAILLKVRTGGSGASCHLGYHSCFFRTIPVGAAPTPATELAIAAEPPAFDPETVYGSNKSKTE